MWDRPWSSRDQVVLAGRWLGVQPVPPLRHGVLPGTATRRGTAGPGVSLRRDVALQLVLLVWPLLPLEPPEAAPEPRSGAGK